MTNVNKTKNSLGTKPTELDFWERKISRMNASYIITIPKIFVKNSPFGEFTKVRISMLEDGCLKLTPLLDKNGKNEPAEFSIM